MTEFVHENIRIIHGDCMNYMKDLPDNAFELSIIDPPYGIGADKMTLGNGKTKIYRGNNWDNKAPDVNYFIILQRISLNQIIWGINNFVETFHKNSRAWILWDKGTGDNDYSDGELAWTSFDKVLKIYKKSWVGANAKDGILRIHPTQKPVALYKWLLKNYAKETDRVIDTHLGSGSSAIAAWEFGCKEFVGIEIDREYYDAAVKRFKNHVAQKKLF